MIFKDRAEAGQKLAEALKKEKRLTKSLKQTVVVSLLRGGILVGAEIAKKLKIKHLPLAVAKIPSPDNPELAIGALCFDTTYLEPKIISSLNLKQASIQNQIKIAKEKFNGYVKRFSLDEKKIEKAIKNKIVVLTDDGIATGSTIKAAALFCQSKKAKKIFLAVPVAPTDFEERGFDKVLILHKDPFLSAVSQFYQNFPQVEDEEVKKIIARR